MPYVVVKQSAAKVRKELIGDKAERKRLEEEVVKLLGDRDVDELGPEERTVFDALSEQRAALGREVPFEVVHTADGAEVLAFAAEDCGVAHVVAREQGGGDEAAQEFLFATVDEARAALGA